MLTPYEVRSAASYCDYDRRPCKRCPYHKRGFVDCEKSAIYNDLRLDEMIENECWEKDCRMCTTNNKDECMQCINYDKFKDHMTKWDDKDWDFYMNVMY